MQIGIHSFASIVGDPKSGLTVPPSQRLVDLIEEAEIADGVGLDVFAVGEHHRREFLDSAPAIILAAIAARTRNIRLTSAVTVLGATDPVRVFQEFATIDLISAGRAEIIVGRGSFGEAFPLFGLDTNDYDALFAEKLDLLLKLRESESIHWKGRFRPALSGQSVFPRPFQRTLPVLLGAGGTPASFVRAGTLGLPLMVGIIGGEFRQFQRLIALYRTAWDAAGHPPKDCRVGINTFGMVAETTEAAKEAFYPGWQSIFASVGRERGWAPPTRAQFEHMCGPDGTFLIGDPQTVAAKTIAADAILGGVSRVSFQLGTALLPHRVTTDAIRLLGSEVAPIVRAGVAVQQRAAR